MVFVPVAVASFLVSARCDCATAGRAALARATAICGDVAGTVHRGRPGWLRALVGKEYFDEIVELRVGVPALTYGRRRGAPAYYASELRDGDLCELVTVLRGVSTLRALHLDGAKLTDAGAEHLTLLTSLEVLTIRDTGIGDRGARYLVALPRLEFLDIGDSKVTQDGIGLLRQLKPSLKIANQTGYSRLY